MVMALIGAPEWLVCGTRLALAAVMGRDAALIAGYYGLLGGVAPDADYCVRARSFRRGRGGVLWGRGVKGRRGTHTDRWTRT